MLRLLFTIVSYGSLLLLLMPATVTGILAAAVILFAGIGVILYRRRKCEPRKDRRPVLLLPAILLAIQYGWIFYNRWIPSSQIRAIAAMIRLPAEPMLFVIAALLAGCALYCIYTALYALVQKTSDPGSKGDFVRNLVFSAAAAVMTVVLAQVMLGIGVFSMGCRNFMWSVWIVMTAILCLFCVFGKVRPAIFLGTVPFLIISTINVYVYSFRLRLFEPVDVFSAVTAMNVADNYHFFPIPDTIISGWGCFGCMMMVLGCLSGKSHKSLTAKRRIALLAACAASFVAIHSHTASMKTFHWYKEGAWEYGYILDFASKLKEMSAERPENYSGELVSDLAEQYVPKDAAAGYDQKDLPHILVIMNEAFADLTVAGDFTTNTEVMPFISSLEEDTIRGYALASVFGGNTANSEYEFLTGYSFAWLSPNAVPYQQYVRSSTNSMASYLKSMYRYQCVAMHPYESSSWNRPAAYDLLGFDECYFMEDFPQEDYIREYISDREMFDFLIDTFEEQKAEPLFVFGVSMQNHGGYVYTGENYTQTISLNDHDFPDVDQYLSLIHETDKAVEELITYFRNSQEDVLIVFFGDHQPKLDHAFYETISGKEADTLDEQQKRFKVPFFIWANYDIEEAYLECTSLNYLASHVYEAAGLAAPAYNRFLRDMEKVIPAINANGYYSLSAGGYLPFEEAAGEELQWLEWYEILQYNSIFDKNKNEAFFPVTD